MEANDASLGSGDATTRAQELRASLGARQDAETFLAEASRIRQDAAVAADALVEEAQQLSAQLVAESRQSAELVTNEARERADGVLARARIEAEEVAERARATADAIRSKAESDIEEHRRRVRAEVTAQVTRDLTEQHRVESAQAREQSEALISDLEASVRILGVSLESALANVSELLGALEGLRAPVGPTPTHVMDPDADHGPAPAEHVTVEQERAARDRLADEPVPQPVGAIPDGMSYDARRTPAPATSVPSATSQFGTDVDQLIDEHIDDQTDEQTDEHSDDEDGSAQGRPRSATEAFLSSTSLEIEQSSRELRDLQHPEETRKRRSEESRRAAQRRELEEGLPDEEPEPTDGARPLGWLFRTAQ